MILDTAFLTALSLLLLRIILAIVFFSSGRGHLQHPEERAKSVGLSPSATRVLGLVEILAAVSVAFGIYAQIGAILLIGIMLGAISKKIFVWNTGFYAEKGYGWHYDLILLPGSFVIFTTGGGSWVIF